MLAFAIFIAMACTDKPKDSGINREELVQRHNIRFETIDSTEIPQVGKQPNFEIDDDTGFKQDMSGVWRGSFGLVHLSQNGTNVFGEYQSNPNTAYRVAPIHPFLLDELNFLAYVKKIKKQGHDRLFPELNKGRDGYA